MDKLEDLSDCELEAWVVVLVVLGVTDVPVSPVVTEFCDGAHSCTVTQEEMRFAEPQVKAPPLSRRRMMPPTPLQKIVLTI